MLILGVLMFRVERPQLLAEISSVIKERSVILTGSAGVGKSWLIARFVRGLRSAGQPHLALSAEDFDARSIDELTRALNLKTGLLTLIASLGPGAVLIIDGLDALRSEASQRTFRQLIQAVNATLPHCAILASIRSFDLRQSTELQRLFFMPASSSRQFTEIAVGSLNDGEVASISVQVPGLESLLRESNQGFRELIRNPFNLHLCALLLRRGTSWQELSLMQSQAQLLEIYWAARIDRPLDGQARKTFLRRVARQMVDRNTLSLPDEVLDGTESTEIMSVLRSEEILKVGTTGRISFAHNILFDYAVARLLVDEQSVLRFIAEDPSRTIFLRPSLSFFFHFLWLTDRALFWKVALEVLASEGLLSVPVSLWPRQYTSRQPPRLISTRYSYRRVASCL